MVFELSIKKSKFNVSTHCTAVFSSTVSIGAAGSLSINSIGVCQAGTSAAIADDPDSGQPVMAIGAPGVFRWRGAYMHAWCVITHDCVVYIAQLNQILHVSHTTTTF